MAFALGTNGRPAEDSIRAIPARSSKSREGFEDRLRRFREMLKLCDETADKRPAFPWEERGWRREDLYEDRGLPAFCRRGSAR